MRREGELRSRNGGGGDRPATVGRRPFARRVLGDGGPAGEQTLPDDVAHLRRVAVRRGQREVGVAPAEIKRGRAAAARLRVVVVIVLPARVRLVVPGARVVPGAGADEPRLRLLLRLLLHAPQLRQRPRRRLYPRAAPVALLRHAPDAVAGRRHERRRRQLLEVRRHRHGDGHRRVRDVDVRRRPRLHARPAGRRHAAHRGARPRLPVRGGREHPAGVALGDGADEAVGDLDDGRPAARARDADGALDEDGGEAARLLLPQLQDGGRHEPLQALTLQVYHGDELNRDNGSD